MELRKLATSKPKSHQHQAARSAICSGIPPAAVAEHKNDHTSPADASCA
jgi:hypothetical protein